MDRTDTNGEIYHSAYAFKVGSDTAHVNHVYYYHNTIVLAGSDKNGNGVQDAGGFYFSGLISRNNLWIVTRKVYKLGQPETSSNHDLDCESLFSERLLSGKDFIEWSNTGGPSGDGLYKQLEDFQAYTGQELDGMTGGNTKFYFNHSLRSGSPEIDSGCMIEGFNDRGPWKFFGEKPDIGAFEFTTDLILFYIPVIQR